MRSRVLHETCCLYTHAFVELYSHLRCLCSGLCWVPIESGLRFFRFLCSSFILQVESTQGLRDILITIGRYNSLEQHYTRVRMRPLKRLWEEFEAARVGIPLAKPAATDNSAGGDRRPATMSTSVNGLTTSFADWLPHFYDEVLLVLEQELKWYAIISLLLISPVNNCFCNSGDCFPSCALNDGSHD